MRKIDALQHFKESFVKEKSAETMLALEDYYQKHKDTLAAEFIQSFRQACLKIKEMQSRGQKGKIGYITYSMLRTAIMEGQGTHIVDAYDKYWFFDGQECRAAYDAGWAFGFLDRLAQEMEEGRKVYGGILSTPDIENIKLKEAGKYNQYVVELARYAMPGAAALKEFAEIERDEELEVRVGEYMDISEVVYKEDRREKDSGEIKEWLEEKLQYQYAYNVLKNLDLSEGNYEGIDLRYTNLEGSSFTGSNMRGCILAGAKFNRCLLQRVNFEGANLEGADFEDADLRGAVLRGARLKAANFRGAKLEDAEY